MSIIVERGHGVHEIGFDYGFANVAFAGGAGGHRAAGEDEAHQTGRGEMVVEPCNRQVIHASRS
jgi:hypothetical protein